MLKINKKFIFLWYYNNRGDVVKKGTSLVEVITVIIIMGVIATITTAVVVSVIARQKRNATINALNNIYETTKGLLIQVEAGDYDDNITLVDDDFCYISLTTLIDSGNVDGKDYKPVGQEVYFCYDMNIAFVVITDGSFTKVKPSSTGSTTVNEILVTFSYEKDKFIIA